MSGRVKEPARYNRCRHMGPHLDTVKSIDRDNGADAAWKLALAAANRAEALADSSRFMAFSLGNDAELLAVALGDPEALIAWRPGVGWEPLLSADDPRHALVDLYL